MSRCHTSVTPHELVIWSCMNALAVIELDFKQGISANESRRIEQAYDQAAVFPYAVAPKQFTGVVPSGHLLQSGCRPVDKCDACIAAKAARVRRFSETRHENVARNAKKFHRARERKGIRRDDADRSLE